MDGMRWKRSSTERKVKQKGSNLIMEKKSYIQTAVQQSTEKWELFTDRSRSLRQVQQTRQRQFISLT